MTEKTKFFKDKLKFFLDQAIDTTTIENGLKKYIEMDFGNGVRGSMYYEEDKDGEILDFHFKGDTDEKLRNEIKNWNK